MHAFYDKNIYTSEEIHIYSSHICTSLVHYASVHQRYIEILQVHRINEPKYMQVHYISATKFMQVHYVGALKFMQVNIVKIVKHMLVSNISALQSV